MKINERNTLSYSYTISKTLGLFRVFGCVSNKSNNNKVFGDDENNIFKVIDYTQIMTPDEFNNSKYSSNSNKLNQISSSHGTNTNQDTDYNSLKKFNNNEDFGDNNYYNRGSDINFSFNNM